MSYKALVYSRSGIICYFFQIASNNNSIMKWCKNLWANNQKQTCWGWTEGPTRLSGPCAHWLALWTLTDICRRIPELAGPSLALCAYKHYTACNISLHSQFVGRSMKVCGGIAVHPSMDISPNNNALLHVAMVCRQFLKDKGIDITEKPPTLAWHKSNRSPRGHYILVHLMPPGCTSDVPGAQWCPDVGGDLPAHHPSSH